MSFGRLVLRSAVGGLMLGHGLQKLTGAFDGPGLEETEKSMAAIGLFPPREQAMAAALSETVGGTLTAVGALSPLGPAMIIGTMAVAMNKVHLPKGLWLTKGGYEYNLLLMAAAFVLAAEGPGAASIDRISGTPRRGLRWGLASAVLGLAAAAATLAISDRFAPNAADLAPVDEPTVDTDVGSG
jgi:putative oxidoreductase